MVCKRRVEALENTITATVVTSIGKGFDRFGQWIACEFIQ